MDLAAPNQKSYVYNSWARLVNQNKKGLSYMYQIPESLYKPHIFLTRSSVPIRNQTIVRFLKLWYTTFFHGY